MKVISVYAITQKSTGIVYVGSSINTTLRWRRHRTDLNCGRHHATWLQRAWTKYGEHDFEFSTLEVLQSQDGLIEREKFWISKFPVNFNMKQPDIERGVLIHGNATRAKMSASQRRRADEGRGTKEIPQEQREKISRSLKGRVFSPEWRQKLSEAARNRAKITEATREKLRLKNKTREYGPLSEEQKQKMSAAHKGKTLTAEHRAKIGASLKEAYTEGRRK